MYSSISIESSANSASRPSHFNWNGRVARLFLTNVFEKSLFVAQRFEALRALPSSTPRPRRRPIGTRTWTLAASLNFFRSSNPFPWPSLSASGGIDSAGSANRTVRASVLRFFHLRNVYKLAHIFIHWTSDPWTPGKDSYSPIRTPATLLGPHPYVGAGSSVPVHSKLNFLPATSLQNYLQNGVDPASF